MGVAPTIDAALWQVGPWPSQIHVRRAQPSEAREVLAWIKARHYLRSTPPGYVAVLEFLHGPERVGAAILRRPAARSLDPDRVLELTRFYLVDWTATNAESRCLALVRKFVRTWLPNVRLLLAYSDPEAGHTGMIYEADGWAPFGMTDRHRGYGWKSREGRSKEHLSRKQRWVRTP